MATTIGWGIEDWLSAQRASSSEEGLARLVAHTAAFDKDDTAWIEIAGETELAAAWAELQKIPEAKSLPLYGVPFAPKDNIDVLPWQTTVACPAFAYQPTEDAAIVKILRAAGAIPLGKTNMDQFATGLVGTRTPYGAVPSALSPAHCSGGSSAGSANVVSKGQAPFSLGTDTAGSGRVPAMHNNLVGLKPTRGALSTTGVVPACKDLDCVSIFSLTLPDAQRVFKLVAQYDERDSYSRPLPAVMPRTFGPTPRLAVPDVPLFFTDTDQVGSLFDEAVAAFAGLGVEIVKADFTPMYKLGACLYEGPWVAERYTVVRRVIESTPEAMDPTVRAIIAGSKKFDAADVFEWEHKRKDLVREIEVKFASCDGFLVPTAPMSPTIAAVGEDPFTLNSKQGTYTNFVNYSDYSALAIPAGFRPDGMPFGVTLVARKHCDYALLDLATKFLAPQRRRLGALARTSTEGADALVESLLPAA
ncbi:amidase signature domain-containing protein [Dipodascopsis tothii]|uniref:amidase signature domain-containing protein n=1 Tax=Dipodascopsis tothii TaxID=44089 RepID=UPI0034CFA851